MSFEAAKRLGELSHRSNDDACKFIQEMKNENTVIRNLESYESAVVEKSKNHKSSRKILTS